MNKQSFFSRVALLAVAAGLVMLALARLSPRDRQDSRPAEAQPEMTSERLDSMTRTNVVLVSTALQAFHAEHGIYPVSANFFISRSDSNGCTLVSELKNYYPRAVEPIDPYTNMPLVVSFSYSGELYDTYTPGLVVVRVLDYGADPRTASKVEVFGVGHNQRRLSIHVLDGHSVTNPAVEAVQDMSVPTMTWAEFKDVWSSPDRHVELVDSLPGYFTVNDTLHRLGSLRQ